MAEELTKNLSLASTALTAGGNVASGIAKNRAAGYEAAGLRTAGIQAQASGQRKAYAENRQKNLVLSRAQAVAAASGGGAADKSVLDTMARIEAQGEYNQHAALYEGQAARNAYDTEAALTKWEGKQALTAGAIKGASTALTGGMSLYEKYGGKKAKGASQQFAGDTLSDWQDLAVTG